MGDNAPPVHPPATDAPSPFDERPRAACSTWRHDAHDAARGEAPGRASTSLLFHKIRCRERGTDSRRQVLRLVDVARAPPPPAAALRHARHLRHAARWATGRSHILWPLLRLRRSMSGRGRLALLWGMTQMTHMTQLGTGWGRDRNLRPPGRRKGAASAAGTPLQSPACSRSVIPFPHNGTIEPASVAWSSNTVKPPVLSLRVIWICSISGLGKRDTASSSARRVD